MTRYDVDYDFDYGYEYRGPSPRSGRGRRPRGTQDRGWKGHRRSWDWPGYAAEYPPAYRGYGLGYAGEYRPTGYDGDFRKSRWETDYGDPFRDRERGTPIRMMRGGWGTYGGDFYRPGRERLADRRGRYGRDYRFRSRNRRF